MRKLFAIFVSLSAFIIFLITLPVNASEKSFLDFNEQGASGTTRPGWTWTLTASYSDPGWTYNNTANHYPRIFQKGDYGNLTLAAIDTTMRAPSTFSGASLKLYDASNGSVTIGSISLNSNLLTVSDPSGYKVGDALLVSGMQGLLRGGATLIDAINENVFTLRDSCNIGTYCSGSLSNVQVKAPMQPSFWVWYDYNTMLTNGYATTIDDRFSMYLYLQGYPTYLGGDPENTFEWGTYNCWPNGGYGGENCPTEANNQHYYHTLNINPGTWVHILWDKHPSHQRGVTGAVANNPTTFVSTGKDYFETMNSLYLQATQFANQKNAAFWLDELFFTSAADLGEPNQNDISIANIYVGYWRADNHWEIGWDDLTDFSNHDSKYEIRWSTSPINNSNYAAANIVTPINNVVNGTNIHKANTWKYQLWTKFSLPNETELNNNKIFFAVKDVSVAGGLYRNSPSSSIHTIDYNIRPTNTPRRPANLTVTPISK